MSPHLCLVLSEPNFRTRTHDVAIGLVNPVFSHLLLSSSTIIKRMRVTPYKTFSGFRGVCGRWNCRITHEHGPSQLRSAGKAKPGAVKVQFSGSSMRMSAGVLDTIDHRQRGYIALHNGQQLLWLLEMILQLQIFNIKWDGMTNEVIASE